MRPDEDDKNGSTTAESPQVPRAPEVPKAPEINAKLPPHPARMTEVEPGVYQRMGIAYTIPLALVTPIILLICIGAWVDRRYGFGSWCTLGGALLGFICGMINMIRIASKLNR